MIYKLHKFKVIHPEESYSLPDNLKFVTGELIISARLGKQDKRRLPLVLTWTFRISDNQKHFTSFIADAYYLLGFAMDENPFNDIIKLIEESFNQFSHEFFVKFFGLNFQENPLPALSEDSKNKTANQIIESAKREFLLFDKS